MNAFHQFKKETKMDVHIGNVVLPIGRMGAGGTINLLGTCFAVDERRVATAAHVVGPSDEGLKVIIGKTNSLNDYQDTTDNTVQTCLLKIVHYNPVYDIAILELSDPRIRALFTYSIGSADDIPTGAPVVSLGYPHADHGRLVLTQQSSMIGARVLLGLEDIKLKHVVLNTQTRPGQSGGPVFNAEGSKICAMITGGYSPTGSKGGISLGGVDPQTLHQTTHAISAEYIQEML